MSKSLQWKTKTGRLDCAGFAGSRGLVLVVPWSRIMWARAGDKQVIVKTEDGELHELSCENPHEFLAGMMK